MTLKEAMRKMEELDEEFRRLNEKRRLATKEVIALSPYKAGDTVIINGDAYSGKQMIVQEVQLMSVGYSRRRWVWLVMGKLLRKKDGRPGVSRVTSTFEIDLDE